MLSVGYNNNKENPNSVIVTGGYT